MPPIKFGNPVDRDPRGKNGILKVKKEKVYWKGPPIKPGDPTKREKPPTLISNPPSRKKPKGSNDIVLPYKRRYGRGKPIIRATTRKKPKEEITPLVEETAGEVQEPTTTKTQVMERTQEDQQSKKEKSKRTVRNIIGITVLGLVVTGFLMYKMKTKMEANGHTR